MHDKEQKHGLNPISNASLRAMMAAWTSPSVFLLQRAYATEHASHTPFFHVNSVTG